MTDSPSPDPVHDDDVNSESGHPEPSRQEVAHAHDGAIPADEIEADRAHQDAQEQGRSRP